MKRLLYLFMSVTLIIGVSCEGEEGPEGPAGPAGPQGPQGTAGLPGTPGADGSGKVYNISGFTFEPDNDGVYGLVLDFELNEIEVENSDVVLVYQLIGGIAGETPDEDILYWEPLPQTYFLDAGILQYKFYHSDVDLVILMDANFDLAGIDPGYTDDLIFRIVVLPGEVMTGGRSLPEVDYNNYEEVVKYFKLDDKNIIEVKAK